MTFVSGPWLWALIVVPVLVTIVWRRRWDLARFCVAAGIVVGLVDFVCSEWVKPNVGRLRPCKGFPDLFPVIDSCGGAFGFPSNHAANSMAIAVLVFFNLSRRWGAGLMVFSLLVGFSRVYLGVHYPGDVTAGWLAGACAAAAASAVFRARGWFARTAEGVSAR